MLLYKYYLIRGGGRGEMGVVQADRAMWLVLIGCGLFPESHSLNFLLVDPLLYNLC